MVFVTWAGRSWPILKWLGGFLGLSGVMSSKWSLLRATTELKPATCPVLQSHWWPWCDLLNGECNSCNVFYPQNCLGPFHMENYGAQSTDLCQLESAAGAHLNPFKKLVVSQIHLVGRRVVNHPCCSKQVSSETWLWNSLLAWVLGFLPLAVPVPTVSSSCSLCFKS